MTFFGPTPVQTAVNEALQRLEVGEEVRERQVIDLKEEAGRRGPGGVIQPGSARNEVAAQQLAAEVACMANTHGGGALIVGVDDHSALLGTELDPEWLRGRLYEKLQRRLTVEVQPVTVRGTRLLVITAPEAVEPIRWKDKVFWRVSDKCVEIDSSTWHDRRHHRLQVDWSAQLSTLTAAEVRAGAIEVARDFLRESGDSSAQDLADAPTPDLLRRLNAVDGDGKLTNAAALLFVGRPEPCLDYMRREVAGGDSQARVHRPDRSLIEQLQEVFTTARAHNPVRHIGDGLAVGQVRQIPERALREAIVNGVAHREWHLAAPTVIEHIGGLLRVTSPGGFVSGITAQNIINHPSTSRNTRLTELLAVVKVAEREGIGVDRMYGDMLRLGHPAPAIVEVGGPQVVTSLIANDIDDSWIAWLDQLDDPMAKNDLRILMSLKLVVEQGWVDEERLAPFLQLPVAEAQDVVNMLAGLTIKGTGAFTDVQGVPAGTSLVKALSPEARATLQRLDSRHHRHRRWPTREKIALSYARARGRISTTELGELVGASATNLGGVLNGLEEQGILRPSRTQRRGAGFHYVYVPEAQQS